MNFYHPPHRKGSVVLAVLRADTCRNYRYAAVHGFHHLQLYACANAKRAEWHACLGIKPFKLFITDKTAYLNSRAGESQYLLRWIGPDNKEFRITSFLLDKGQNFSCKPNGSVHIGSMAKTADKNAGAVSACVCGADSA